MLFLGCFGDWNECMKKFGVKMALKCVYICFLRKVGYGWCPRQGKLPPSSSLTVLVEIPKSKLIRNVVTTLPPAESVLCQWEKCIILVFIGSVFFLIFFLFKTSTIFNTSIVCRFTFKSPLTYKKLHLSKFPWQIWLAGLIYWRVHD